MTKRKNKKQKREKTKMQNPKTMTPNVISKLAAETGIQSTWKPSQQGCPLCGESESVYELDDMKTYYCLKCSEEFAVLHSGEIVTQEWSENFEDINKACGDMLDGKQPQLSGFTHKFSNVSNTQVNSGWLPGTTQPVTRVCTHNPTHVIAGRGWSVWAGKKYDVEDCANDFDVVLNLTYTPIKEKRVIPIPELNKWESYHQSFAEIQIDWPDYGISTLPREFWEDLITYLRTNKKRLLVFCTGGHGRTGTAVATMLCVGLGWSAKRAINWVRKNYCDEAIETKGQELYVELMAQQPKIEKQRGATN